MQNEILVVKIIHCMAYITRRAFGHVLCVFVTLECCVYVQVCYLTYKSSSASLIVGK